MEDYKKKYEEAIERMKSWVRGEHPECFTEAQKAAEFVFPELKKSEDDKIREWIINYLEVRLPDAGEFLDEYVRAIDWLARKQPQPTKLSAEDAKMIDDIINDIDIAYESAQIEQLKDIYSKEIDLLRRIKEQYEK